MSKPLPCVLYETLPPSFEGVYFGEFPSDDYKPLTSNDWFHTNHRRFIRPIKVIAQARQPYGMNAGPVGEGVYFLFLGDLVVYVGQSRQIVGRLGRHGFPYAWKLEPDDWFSHYSALWVPVRFLDSVEAYYIHLLRPRWNNKYPPLDHLAGQYFP